MIFVARQLVKKAREHSFLLFTLFIDLKKAYNSVPCRAALWQVLEKYLLFCLSFIPFESFCSKGAQGCMTGVYYCSCAV